MITSTYHTSRALVLATLIALAVATSVSAAESGLDRCNDVLQQDLFNRTSATTQSASSARAFSSESFLSLDETKAWNEYKKAAESTKTQDISGAGNVQIGLNGGAAEFASSYGRRLGEQEFRKKFREAQQEVRQNKQSSSSSDASMISIYTSTVRDPETIKAWERCMATRNPEPGLFAYGYRDEGGHPYIVVMWNPGPLAAATPVINVRFNITDADMFIDGVGPDTQIATGSGAVFPVRFKAAGDRRASSDGFAVLINGELKRGTELVSSFRSEAVVPRNLGPVPCSAVFAPSRTYDLGVWSEQQGGFVWGQAELSTAGAVPTASQGGLLPGTLFMQGRSAPILLRLSGSDVTIADKQRPFVTAQCTGQGVRGRFANTQFCRDCIVGIRPRR